jgi:hypothetical protein
MARKREKCGYIKQKLLDVERRMVVCCCGGQSIRGTTRGDIKTDKRQTWKHFHFN